MMRSDGTCPACESAPPPSLTVYSVIPFEVRASKLLLVRGLDRVEIGPQGPILHRAERSPLRLPGVCACCGSRNDVRFVDVKITAQEHMPIPSCPACGEHVGPRRFRALTLGAFVALGASALAYTVLRGSWLAIAALVVSVGLVGLALFRDARARATLRSWRAARGRHCGPVAIVRIVDIYSFTSLHRSWLKELQLLNNAAFETTLEPQGDAKVEPADAL